MDRDVLAAVGRLTLRQHGLVTRAQLLAAGASASSITRAVGGLLLPRAHGVYAVLGSAPTWRQMVLAHILGIPGTAAATGTTAARLHGVGGRFWHAGDATEVHLAVRRRVRSRGATCHLRADLHDLDVTVVDDIPAVTPARLLLDLARSTRRPLDDLLVEMTASGLVDAGAVLELLDRVGPAPGSARLERSLAILDRGRFRSHTEHRVARAIEAAGLPRPLVNHVIAVRGRRVEVDLAWPEVRHIVEIDGPHHALPPQHRRDRARDDLLARSGWTVARVPVADVDDRLHEVVAAIGDRLTPPLDAHP